MLCGFPVCGLPLCSSWRFFTILRKKILVWQGCLWEKNACNGSKQATFIFRYKKAHKTKSFCFRIMKNCQLQHKGNPHTQEKSQGAAISMEDATTYSVRTSEIDTSGLCTWRKWCTQCPGGCRISHQGGMGIPQSTSLRSWTQWALFRTKFT